MKKLLTITIIFGICMVVNSQDVKFGLKGGVNFASLLGKDVEGVKTKTAFHAGVLSEIPFSDKFSFQPELLYSVQGINETNSAPEFVLNYLQLPLMVKYYVAEGFSLEAGPQIGILLSAKAKFEGEDEEDVTEVMNDFEYGINLGLGYKLDSGLSFGTRYNLGLAKVFNTDFFDDDVKAYNSVIQISIGYFF